MRTGGGEGEDTERRKEAARFRALQLQTTVQSVGARWIGRGKEVTAIVGLVGADQPPIDVFVYGGPSTGKTAVVKDVFEELGLKNVYIDCNEYAKEGRLLSAIADGLKFSKGAKKWDGGEESCRFNQLPEFIRRIPELVAKNGMPTYIILDNARSISEADVLAPLLRLRELTAGCNIGVVLIASVGWEIFSHRSLAEKPPVPVLFRAYEEPAIIQILTKERREQAFDAQQYSAFVRGCITPFIRCTRNLHMLHAVTERLFAKYKSFIDLGKANAGDVQTLHKLLRPHIQEALDTFQTGIGLSDTEGAGQAGSGTGSLDFELPYMSKFILLASYIASRNSVEADKRIFDSSGGRGKRRRVNANQADKQIEAAKEAMLAGPKRFDTERLLAVFWSLMDSEAGDDPFCNSVNVQSSEIFMQISALVSLRLLTKVLSEDALSSCQYHCNLPDSLATKVAKNLKVDLSKYLAYV